MKLRNSFKAFSLIELLIVIAILAILSSIAFIQYNKYRVNAIYSKMEEQLHLARTWAESETINFGKFPNGVCDASTHGGTIKCLYDADSDSITIDPSGDLRVSPPFKVGFIRNSTSSNCGWVVVTCPAGGCAGLKGPGNSGDAKICINTCSEEEKIIANTNLFTSSETCPSI